MITEPDRRAYANIINAPDPAAGIELVAAHREAGLEGELAKLRGLGWMVAVHNDYRFKGTLHTFWLFTHPDGRWVKGEGWTDDEAVHFCLEAALGEH